MPATRLRTFGPRRPVGPIMRSRARAVVGGTGAATHTARVQPVLSIHRKRCGSRGPEPGGVPARLPHARQLRANVWCVHYRRTKRDRLTDSIDDAPQASEVHAAERTPHQHAEAMELSAQVQMGLARLSPDLREAVMLRDLQGMEYGEIRKALQVPEGTVKSRINRGRIELARILREMGIRLA